MPQHPRTLLTFQMTVRPLSLGWKQ